MGGKSAPDPPDYSGVAQASEENAKMAADIAREQLAWSREQWADQREIISDVLDFQFDVQDEQWKLAKEDRQRWEQKFRPLQDRYTQQLEEWGQDTPEREARRVSMAEAEVASQFEAQRQNALRRLESYGVDPSQTRNAALDVGARIEEAKAKSLAANQARLISEQDEREALGYMGEAVNVGAGLPSQGLQYASQGLAASQAGAGTSGAWQGAGQAMGNPATWMGASNQAVGTWGNTLSNQHRNNIAAYRAEQESNPIGPLLGLAGTVAGGYFGGGFAEGGEAVALPVPGAGGAVAGPGGPKDDAIPARLSDGEYVIPEEVVARKGTEFFDKLVGKTREELSEREARGKVSAHALALPPPEARV